MKVNSIVNENELSVTTIHRGCFLSSRSSFRLYGVEVAVAGTFSGSESVSSGTINAVCFLATGATSFSISF